MQDQAYAASEAKSAREATLNERLNRVGEQFNSQCDRIEGVLSRVNGTPQPPKTGDRIGEAPTPIRPTQSLSQIVENLEMLAKRLSELRTGVERIA